MIIKHEDGSTEKVFPRDIKVIKKASESQPGNDLEIETQGDGGTVGIKEANFSFGKKKVDAELNEIGVYKSEKDTENNPKTGENTPDELTGIVEKLKDTVTQVITALGEMKSTVEENSNLSTEPIGNCIDELTAYVNSLQAEMDKTSGLNPN